MKAIFTLGSGLFSRVRFGEEGRFGEFDSATLEDMIDLLGGFGQEWFEQQRNLEEAAHLVCKYLAQVVLVAQLSNFPWFFGVNVLVKATDLVPDVVEGTVEAALGDCFGNRFAVVLGRGSITNNPVLITLHHSRSPLDGIA